MGICEAVFIIGRRNMVSMVSRNLEERSSQLRGLVTDIRLHKQVLQDILKKVPRPSRKREMVGNIRMEYNIFINRCISLILL
ncbi:MAG: hypothetical protein WBB24_11275, partial [Maribacter sp.]